jgi:hypothetical protein
MAHRLRQSGALLPVVGVAGETVTLIPIIRISAPGEASKIEKQTAIGLNSPPRFTDSGFSTI